MESSRARDLDPVSATQQSLSEQQQQQQQQQQLRLLLLHLHGFIVCGEEYTLLPVILSPQISGLSRGPRSLQLATICRSSLDPPLSLPLERRSPQATSRLGF
jgi:hypothetical protein